MKFEFQTIAFELDEMRGILTNDNLSDREKAKQMALTSRQSYHDKSGKSDGDNPSS